MGLSTKGQVLKDSSKYLFFRDTSTAYTVVPVNNVVGFSDDAGSTTGLIVYLLPLDNDAAGQYNYVELTVTDRKKAIEDIMNAINFSKQSVITVADNLESDYLSDNITGTNGESPNTSSDQT